jgi:hypothetical protein
LQPFGTCTEEIVLQDLGVRDGSLRIKIVKDLSLIASTLAFLDLRNNLGHLTTPNFHKDPLAGTDHTVSFLASGTPKHGQKNLQSISRELIAKVDVQIGD